MKWQGCGTKVALLSLDLSGGTEEKVRIVGAPDEIRT
jgi:hypothetical protein